MKRNLNKKRANSEKSQVKSESVLGAGARGPLLFQNIIIYEKMMRFKREKLEVTRMNFSSSFAHGRFTVTNDLSNYTTAKIFSKKGGDIKILTRFSHEKNENSTIDSHRDPKEFAIKLYTEAGNWDLMGRNTPVIIAEDVTKFPDYLAQRLDSSSGVISPGLFWDYCSMNPESLHYALMRMSDHITPVGYLHMNGYGDHILTMKNANKEEFLVRFHLKTTQGIRNFNDKEAEERKEKDAYLSHLELVNAIAEKDFPKWELKIQVMTLKQAQEHIYNPFDRTKIWSHNDFPLIDVGEIELNEICEDEVGELAECFFAPKNVVDGIAYCSYDSFTCNNVNEEQHYFQPQELFNYAMNDYNRQNLISTVTNSMRKIEEGERDEISTRLLSHFFRVDVELGNGIAKGLDVDIERVMHALEKREIEMA